MQVVNRMMEMAEVVPEDVVYDLGCGDGRIVLAAARRYHARAVGIEIDPLRYIWCQFLVTILGQRKRVRIIFGNFFNKDLSEADVVMCYLMPDALTKLEKKFKQEMRSGTRVVSNRFAFPTLDKVREDGDARLYLVHPDGGAVH
jgi:predicted RNA methylase